MARLLYKPNTFNAELLTCIFIVLTRIHLSLGLNSLVILYDNELIGTFEEAANITNSCTKEDDTKKLCTDNLTRLAHAIKSPKEDQSVHKVIYLSTGNVYGTTCFEVHKTNVLISFMNHLRPHMTLGPSESASGPEYLDIFLDSLKFPVLVANVDFKAYPKLKHKVKKSVIIQDGGYKIGIIGVLDRETIHIYGDTTKRRIKLLDEFIAVKKESETLVSRGVRIIILLSRCGLEKDKQLSKKLPLVDVIIGGHNNLAQSVVPRKIETSKNIHPFTQGNERIIPVLQVCTHCKHLKGLNITFDENGNLKTVACMPVLSNTLVPKTLRPIHLSNLVSQQMALRKMMIPDGFPIQFRRARDDEVSHEQSTVTKSKDPDSGPSEGVGRSLVLLDAADNKCLKDECNIGNMVADAIVFLAAFDNVPEGKTWANHPIALVHAGAIKNSVPPSRDSYLNHTTVARIVHSTNSSIAFSLKGEHLLQALENSAKNRGKIGFLQVSGIQVVFKGDKVHSAKARCGECPVPVYKEIDPDKDYNIIANPYIVDGNDGYDMIKDNHFDPEDMTSDTQAVIWYIGRSKPLSSEIDGRIIFGEKEIQVKGKVEHHANRKRRERRSGAQSNITPQNVYFALIKTLAFVLFILIS